MFFRAWVMLSMAIFRLWPLLVAGVYARRHPVSQGTWVVALAATCVLLVIAQVSAMRCSSEHLSHTRGLFAIGAAMSTGWLYVDALLVPAVVTAVLLLSVAMALLPQAPARYLRLVQRMLRHRMQQ